MDILTIKEKLKHKHTDILGSYNKFAVLVPLLCLNGRLHILFEVRASNLPTQPGEICFPGGRIEPGETPLQCAVRETSEELNICPADIEVLSPLDYIVSPFNLILYPFLGVLSHSDLKAIAFNPGEVADLFAVPLDFFLENGPKLHALDLIPHPRESFPLHKIPNGKDYNWRPSVYTVPFYEYQGKVIWGMTATILKCFVDFLK